MSACTCGACRRHVNRFTRLSPAQVFEGLERAEVARQERAALSEEIAAAFASAIALPALEIDKGIERWAALWDARERLPVSAYISPFRRWAGGPVELDAWYWDQHPPSL